jgi:hypothetical protein
MTHGEIAPKAASNGDVTYGNADIENPTPCKAGHRSSDAQKPYMYVLLEWGPLPRRAVARELQPLSLPELLVVCPQGEANNLLGTLKLLQQC